MVKIIDMRPHRCRCSIVDGIRRVMPIRRRLELVVFDCKGLFTAHELNWTDLQQKATLSKVESTMNGSVQRCMEVYWVKVVIPARSSNYQAAQSTGSRHQAVDKRAITEPRQRYEALRHLYVLRYMRLI